MAATSSPYGLQPISDQTGIDRTLRIPFGIASGLNSNIFKYQPVKLIKPTATTNAGTLTPITATTDQIFGIFMGVEYTPTGGRPAVSPWWAAGTVYDSGYDMFAYVWPAWTPGARYAIQADGTVPQTNLGGGFNLSNFGNGNTVVGNSTCTANHTVVAANSQAQLVLVEFGVNINNAIGDAFTDLIVSVAYPQVVSGFQTSQG